jgi:actin-related protein
MRESPPTHAFFTTPDDSARRLFTHAWRLPCFQIGRRSVEDPHRRRIDQIEESKMKSEVEEEGQVADGSVVEEVHPVVRGFVKDWDAMEDLLSYVRYRNIGWEIGDEGQILFTEPLFMPKVMFMPCMLN